MEVYGIVGYETTFRWYRRMPPTDDAEAVFVSTLPYSTVFLRDFRLGV